MNKNVMYVCAFIYILCKHFILDVINRWTALVMIARCRFCRAPNNKHVIALKKLQCF